MLVARRPNIWKARYEIFADGTWVTAWDRSKRSTGGQFDLSNDQNLWMALGRVT